MNIFKNKTILVTGGTGSIGSEIVRELLEFKPKVIRIYTRGESKQFYMRHEMKGHKNLRYLVGDVRDKERLKIAMKDVDIVFHAAALKHVPSCEYNPFEAVKTNVLGTQNVIESALAEGVKNVVSISTDKAASPSNVMGATKLLAERLIASAHYYKGEQSTIMSCVRFGNVLASEGSVIPLFIKQLTQGQTLTLTDPNMTRFIMTIPQAVKLIFEAASYQMGGEIFIFKMPAVKLGILADAVIEVYQEKNNVEFIQVKKNIAGIRPGEKMYEELLTIEESERACQTKDMFILGSNINKLKTMFDATQCNVQRYTSNDVNLLSKEQTKDLLRDVINV